jgi:predicted nucleotide-binding protein
VYSKRQQDSHVSERAVSREHGKDVFIVHGHDQAIKEQVSRFIMSLGLRPIIVSQQPSAGRTIIEQLEVYSKNIRFAVVLLTPDEVSQGRFRARQNVIFELGYFIGKLGRERVCVLYKENVELPSDFHGVLYVPIDSAGGWHLALAEEMIQAHLPVEINKLR